MGSMIHLAVGRLEIDWGKNEGFHNYSALFQAESDVSSVPYYYVMESEDGFEDPPRWKPLVEFKEGLSKQLSEVVRRLDLLGHTYQQCEKEFAFLSQLNGFDQQCFTFSYLQDALAQVDVRSISANYGDTGEDFGDFFRRELAPRLGMLPLSNAERMAFPRFCEAMENLSAYSILQLLARNPSTESLPVQWGFNDVETGGYASREDFVRQLEPQARFLIVTEGGSDATILRHAFKLLRPHIADFFNFVDMEEGYPFSGTGNVYRFVQGLISIAVQNKILVLFDNDAEGLFNYNRCLALNVPTNMRILKLPDNEDFKKFPTSGPDGEHVSDINGRAAAIECYLGLNEQSRVRWTSFNQSTGAYQGELDGKTRYMRDFLKQRKRDPSYDYQRIEQLLDTIVASATTISESNVGKLWSQAF